MQVEDVLKRYPKLKFTWVHAGVSRRCSEPKHYEMIDRLCSTYDNIKVDISWVVWEDVICDGEGKVTHLHLSLGLLLLIAVTTHLVVTSANVASPDCRLDPTAYTGQGRMGQVHSEASHEVLHRLG